MTSSRYIFEQSTSSGCVGVEVLETARTEWTDVLDLDELEGGRPTPVRVGTTPLLLVRVGDAVHATEAVCPHKFADLAEGTVEDGCLRCPLHDAAFHLPSGAPRAGDEWAGHLPTFPCRVEDGRVQVARVRS